MTTPIVHGDLVPLYMQPTTDPNDPAQICYGAADYRLLASAVFPGSGVLGTSDWQITSNSSAIVNIGVGTAAVAGTSAVEQRTYICRNTNVKTIQPPGPPSANNRYDLICLTAHDGQVLLDHLYEWQVQCLSGAEAASPTVPALPKDSIALAAIIRRPGQANILPADITDLRSLATLPVQPKSQTYWKSESVANSANFSTTEIRDATQPFLALTVTDATKVYRIRYNGLVQNSVAGKVNVRIRDSGGTANPGTGSTQIAQGQMYVGAGANNNAMLSFFQDMTLSVGVHTLGVFCIATQAGTAVVVGNASQRKQLVAEIVG
jgi:hypothetical protein